VSLLLVAPVAGGQRISQPVRQDPGLDGELQVEVLSWIVKSRLNEAKNLQSSSKFYMNINPLNFWLGNGQIHSICDFKVISDQKFP
jgi:hypothetical protein